MGRKNPELEAKRAELRRLQKNAGDKIRRIKKGEQLGGGFRAKTLAYLRGNHGVDISGTKYDPRVASSKIGKLSSKQLDSAIARVSNFNTNKEITYFSGYDGAIIKGETLFRAAQATTRYNKKIDAYRKKVENVQTPWIGEGITAGEYDRRFRPRQAILEQQSFYDIQQRRLPSPRRWKSEKNAEKWVSNVTQGLSSKADRKRRRDMKSQIKAMLDVIGDEDLREAINSLTTEQLWFLWTNDPSFADSLHVQYRNKTLDSEEDVMEAKRQVFAKLAEAGNSKIYEMINGIRGQKIT